MSLDSFITERGNEVGVTRSELVSEFGIGWQTLQNIKRGSGISNGTKEKLARALKCSIGDIQDAMKDDPDERRKEEKAKPASTEQEAVAEQEEESEELPFGELEPEPPAETDGIKWYKDKTKEEAPPKKVKVKKEAIPAPEPSVIKIAEGAAKAAEKTMDKVKKATEMVIQSTIQCFEEQGFMPLHDPVNNPEHYTQGDIECIDAIEASMTPEEFRGFLKATTIKYLWRYSLKNGLEDLRKARWYLDRLIKKVGEMQND